MARRRKSNGLDEVNGEAPGGGEGAAPPPANMAARRGIIRDTCETIAEFDRQIDGIKAERTAVIQTQIVAGLGMKVKHFNAAYKFYRMDQEDRDALHDVIREVYRAHDVGFQGNWLDAAEEVSAAAAGD